MADPNEPTGTPPAEPTGTEPTPGEATPPETNPEPVSQEGEKMITIPESSFKKLQSDSTKNFERLRNTEAWVMQEAQKQDISTFLGDAANKEKFPDVEVDDLMGSESPEDFEKLAGQTQARIDKAAQRRLADIQKAGDPSLSPEEKSAKLKKLKENPGSASFQEMLSLEQPA